MRSSCLDCTRKHIAQAIVLICESSNYPEHIDYAIGHLAEAEDESKCDYPNLANEIRESRLKLMRRGLFNSELRVICIGLELVLRTVKGLQNAEVSDSGAPTGSGS